MLNEWTPFLGGLDSVGWLITVVTLPHYQTGPYFRALGEAQSLKPVVLEYCSVFQKFYGQGAMSGDFQDSDRIRAKAQMIRSLLAAIGNEYQA